MNFAGIAPKVGRAGFTGAGRRFGGEPSAVIFAVDERVVLLDAFALGAAFHMEA